jgi:hypothetical protein
MRAKLAVKLAHAAGETPCGNLQYGVSVLHSREQQQETKGVNRAVVHWEADRKVNWKLFFLRTVSV